MSSDALVFHPVFTRSRFRIRHDNILFLAVVTVGYLHLCLLHIYIWTGRDY